MNKIILASKSPRRKKLLQQINLNFEVYQATIDETFNPELTTEQNVQQVALRKSKEVATKFNDALVIGADTIVVFDDRILTKPSDYEDAKSMLSELSGETHQVYTGVGLCKVQNNNITDTITFIEKTNVTFSDISPEDIEAYISTGSPMDKAGGYGIQDDFGAIFVRRIEGDYNNVIGFPLHSFYENIRSFAPQFLPKLL